MLLRMASRNSQADIEQLPVGYGKSDAMAKMVLVAIDEDGTPEGLRNDFE